MKLTKKYIKKLIKEELAMESMPEIESLPISIHGVAQDGAEYTLTITKFDVYADEGVERRPDEDYLQIAIRDLESALKGKLDIE